MVNRSQTQKHRPILEAINNGYSKGGSVSYYAAGGYVAGSAMGSDDIWKLDPNKQPVSKMEVLKKPIDTKVYGHTGLSIGHFIKDDSQVDFTEGGKLNTSINGFKKQLSNSDREHSGDLIGAEQVLSVASGGRSLSKVLT